VQSVELERLTAEGITLIERRNCLELFRDQAVERFEMHTGSSWRPRSGSLVNHRTLTAAMIDSRDFIAAKRRAETEVMLPAGPKIALTGGLDFNDHHLIWDRLDKVHAKHPDMVLIHGGSPKGAELIASKWATSRKVPQIAFKPDWTKHAKAAPFRRNDAMLELVPIGVMHFPGTGIAAALITGIRSDLPGQITAQVTEAVFDSPTGRVKLVPQGARLIGVYDSQVAFGQSRVLLVWTRLIMPNGRSIVLERQQGADVGGYSGLKDEVDNHWAELFKAALLSTVLGVGAELGSGADSGSNTEIIQALRLNAANSLNQTGQQVVRRNLNIQPTLTIRPGFPVRVIVNRDLVLEPYRG
jgi:Bacterial conjugation TrbI-like protein/YspA, cpYpsA-related SLOG family